MKPSALLCRAAISFLLLINLSCTNTRENTILIDNIKATTKQVADWQISNFSYKTEGNLHDYGIDAWTNSVLYLGMLKWIPTTDEPEVYLNWLMNIGTTNKWAIPANFANYPRYSLYHADEMAIGQFYLDMYDIYKQDSMLIATQQRADWIMAHPADSSLTYRNKQRWTWCDALFMAPPVYAHLERITHNKAYLEYMHSNIMATYNHLYDKEEHLFYRDDSYFDKQEANGQKIFWGRGNGWVLAGLANILELLDPTSNIRPFYKKLFTELAQRLIELQSPDGFWHASLLDPDSYPSPETSGTALICYGLAYGVNNGLLDKATYLPLITKTWDALNTAVDENGKLGWVQPIGADPKKVTREMTAVYGVGAYLMAGTEMIKLLK